MEEADEAGPALGSDRPDCLATTPTPTHQLLQMYFLVEFVYLCPSECVFPCLEIICNCVFVFVKRVYCIYIYATNIFPGLILFLYTFYDPLVYQQWAYETCHSYEEDKNSACGCQKSLPRIAGPPPLLQDIYVHSYHT